MKSILSGASMAHHCRFWRPGHAAFLQFQRRKDAQRLQNISDDETHLEAALEWLCAAQDATEDGGFVGRYSLKRGWTSSYPETTGYIIPTLLRLAEERSRPDLKARAERAFSFLIDLQLENGAFPGAEVAENLTEPSPFNSAQILNGLTAFHKHTGDERALHAARRTADWLLDVMDDDGAFRKHYYYNQPSAYAAHLGCWVAEFGAHLGEEEGKPYLDAMSRHVDWVIRQQSENGWYDTAGFDAEQHEKREAFTHTIAYTIWGVLYMGILLGRDDVVASARLAADGVAERLETQGWLPGMLGHDWSGREASACLTGNAQMALIWFKLFELTGEGRYGEVASQAIDLVKMAQPLTSPNPGIRGGIAGSDPVWGAYIFTSIPNWAAKFFIDALLEKARLG
ncbi:MAG: prenyltransferase/squalene oxidase repeat-containing protein [Pseudomonadota bacterium]